MKARTEGAMVQRHSFLTSVLGGGEWLASNPGRLSPAATEQKDEWSSEPISALWRRGNSNAFAGNRTPVRPARRLITTPNTTMTSVKTYATKE
jgi:hypothetical protein